MELNIKIMNLLLQSFLFLLLQEVSTALDDDVRSSCRTAPNDLVFILDGSFSVGPDHFEIVKNWIINISSSFEIGTTFTQVGVVQYSDDPLLEIPLGKHRSNEDLMEAMAAILYRGGNTRTGKAITFGLNNVFATSTRAVNAVTKVAIVLTDGKSQDNVKESAEEARKRKIILFAIGVGQEIEDAELQAIANKPSSTYVFHVEDYTSISRIREIMKQKLCEETVCPTRIPVASRDEKGFDILVGLDIGKKTSRIEGSYHGKKAYRVTAQSDLTERTRDIFPDGLPPSYVFVSTLRFKRTATKEKWDLWRILALDGTIQTAVTLNGEDNTVIFHTTQIMNDTQSVTFTSALIKALFDEKWHLLRVLVTERDATLYLDDKLIETRQLEPVLGIFISGKTQIGKYFGKEATVPFDVQKLRIYCDPEQNQQENACEIPVICDNSLDDFISTSSPCTCSPGPPGPQGIKGESGIPGKNGDQGKPGADGKPGISGLPGKPGIPGHQGIQGLKGFRGYKGEEGRHGAPGEQGVPGLNGLSGPRGPRGPKGSKGESRQHGFEGKKGAKGDKGFHGYPGLNGLPGRQGESGKNGQPGIPGTRGEPGEVGQPGMDGMTGQPGNPGMPGLMGPIGQKGKDGLPGHKGDRGPPGAKGDMGLPGTSGPQGLPGSKGNKGERGLQGIQGQTGSKGCTGEPGFPGQPGHTGMPGMWGITGSKGNPGIQGKQGNRGIVGNPGMPGLQGPRGLAGSKGETGESGSPGTQGIKGQKGEPGIAGGIGPQGHKGNNGLSGIPGPPGPKGNSERFISDEYIRDICMDVLRTQLASVLQNQRNQNFWYCPACKRSSGPPGPAGQPGLPGRQGPSGHPGFDGKQGQPGPSGLSGPPGIQGLMGIPGKKGEKGRRGEGDPGLQGLPGIPGSPGLPGIGKEGYPGRPGSPGNNGAPGKTGRSGSPGPPGTCQPSLCYEALIGRDPFRKGPNY